MIKLNKNLETITVESRIYVGKNSDDNIQNLLNKVSQFYDVIAADQYHRKFDN